MKYFYEDSNWVRVANIAISVIIFKTQRFIDCMLSSFYILKIQFYGTKYNVTMTKPSVMLSSAHSNSCWTILVIVEYF